MRVALSIIVILSVFSTTLAAENGTEKETKEEIISEPNLTNGDILQQLSEDNDNSEITRKKKSTTTTFCVEIRPSGPYQKPFQVCEPAEPAKPGEPAPGPAYSAPAPAYYPSPNNYAVQEQTKTQVSYQPTPSPAYKPASQPKPAPAYSSGAKTFSTSTSSSKSFSGHVPIPYSTYRSKAEESGGEETHNHLHMMRMTHASAEDEVNSAEMRSDHQMRSSGFGGSSYGSSYGGPTSYIPVLPKSLKSKQTGHNGLVITCQPNLAGYAHNVPSSFHHPPSIPSYSYRSSTPRGYGYNRFQQQQAYGGGYQQGPIYKPAPPAYRPQPGVSQSGVPKQQPPHIFPATYQPATNLVYNPPTYKAPPAAYNPAQSHPPPSSPPSPMLFISETSSHQAAEASGSLDYAHSQPSPHGGSISAGYAAPPPPPQLPPNSMYGQPPPPAPPTYASPAYASAAAPAQQQQSFSSFSQSQAFTSAPVTQEHSAASYAAGPASSGPSVYAPPPSYAAPPAPGPNIPPQPPSYIPPGTYRESEDEMGKKLDTNQKDEKEKHTLKKMEEISHQRAADSHWESEISTDRTVAMKPEEHVGHPHQDWAMRSDNDEQMEAHSIAMKGLKTNQVADNEIENSS